MTANDAVRLDGFDLAPMTTAHWDQVESIYAAGIATGHATFEDTPPTWQQFNAFKAPQHRLVALAHDNTGKPTNRVLGWTAVTPISDRSVYAGVVEHSVYVDPASQGHGIGQALLRGLIQSTDTHGIWTIQSGIFPENTASLAAHLAAGFRIVGTRERLGFMGYGPLAGQWRDVTFIEHRSHHTGTPD